MNGNIQNLSVSWTDPLVHLLLMNGSLDFLLKFGGGFVHRPTNSET